MSRTSVDIGCTSRAGDQEQRTPSAGTSATFTSGRRRAPEHGGAAADPMPPVATARSVRPPTDAATRCCVPEFVQQDNGEERQIFQHVPGDRRICPGASADLVHRDHKPGPVKEDRASLHLEAPDGSLVGRHLVSCTQRSSACLQARRGAGLKACTTDRPPADRCAGKSARLVRGARRRRSPQSA